MKNKRWQIPFLVFLLLLFFILGYEKHQAGPSLTGPDVSHVKPPLSPVTPAPSRPPVKRPPKITLPPPIKPPEKPVEATTSTAVATIPAPTPVSPVPTTPTLPPPPLQLHPGLIPKDIAIVRCYYSEKIVPPDVTFGFDINGSGFTSEFEKMIRVEAGGLDIRVKNLRLVTANQIHGDMEVGPEATTEFVYPQVLIKNLPVFRAPDPFGVVRPGEVLHVYFTSMDESGRSGRFRVITNLDEAMAQRFHAEAGSPHLEISNIAPRLPFFMDGTLSLAPGIEKGTYGFTVHIGKREVYRNDKMVHIVHPNVGQTGFVQGITVDAPFHRPGDVVQLTLHGSGFSSQDAGSLHAHVNEFDMGATSFTFLSLGQMQFAFQIPPNAPLGTYGVTVQGQNQETLYEKKRVFQIVPPNWLGGVQVTPPVSPGQKSVLKVVGRDISPEFAKSIAIDLDEPGIHISSLLPMDPSTLAAEISVSTSVAVGDYLLHLSANGAPLKPQFGSLIKVVPPN